MSEMLKNGVRIAPERCPDCSRMVSEMVQRMQYDQATQFVGLAPPQVVQMRHRDVLEPDKADITENLIGALKQILGRRTGESLMQIVRLSQELDIVFGINAREAVARAIEWLDLAILPFVGDEPCYLRIGESGHS